MNRVRSGSRCCSGRGLAGEERLALRILERAEQRLHLVALGLHLTLVGQGLRLQRVQLVELLLDDELGLGQTLLAGNCGAHDLCLMAVDALHRGSLRHELGRVVSDQQLKRHVDAAVAVGRGRQLAHQSLSVAHRGLGLLEACVRLVELALGCSCSHDRGVGGLLRVLSLDVQLIHSRLDLGEGESRSGLTC